MQYMCRTERINIWSALIWWLITVAYMGIIFYLSSRHGGDLPDLSGGLDKVAHLCAYVFLAFLLYFSLKESGIRKYVFVIAFIFASIYGVTDELHQTLVPGRDASIGDVFADTLGAFLGTLWASFIKT